MKRKRGRPPLAHGHESCEVSVSLAMPVYHAIASRAATDRMTVQDVIRRAVAAHLRKTARPRAPRQIVVHPARAGF